MKSRDTASFGYSHAPIRLGTSFFAELHLVYSVAMRTTIEIRETKHNRDFTTNFQCSNEREG